MKTAYLLASAVLLTTACSTTGTEGSGTAGAGADTSGAMAAADPAGADQTPSTALPYVAMAGASDLYEIQSSNLALQKTQNPAIREFAQMMISHHTQTTQQVTAAAQAAGLNPPPPQLMPMQATMLDQLRQASAGDFDRTYIDQQRTAHRMALALHQNYASKGDTPQLRTAASTAVPIVQQHIDRLQQMPGS